MSEHVKNEGEGKRYQIIYADPPWQQTKGGLRKARPNQGKDLDYPTLSLSDINKIIRSVPIEDNGSLFLWTIDSFLYQAEDMFKDCRLHARFIWDKENGIAPAFSVRYSHEYLLWLYWGKYQPIEKDFRGKYTTVIREKSTKHSKKPIQAFTMISQFYPYANKIELFSRYKQIGSGNWDFWGNEVESDINLTTRTEK